MIKRLISVSLLVIGFCSLSAFAESEADAVVTRFHNSFIAMIKTDGYENRLALMRPIIAENFDTKEVAIVALGRNWRQLSDEEKSELTQLSSEVLASGYASRFPQYTDQQFTIGKSTPIVPDRMIVQSKLQTGSETVKLDYQLIEVEWKWKIFDVVADGDSDLSQKRHIYTETFRTEGLAGVIKDIKQHIAQNSKK